MQFCSRPNCESRARSRIRGTGKSSPSSTGENMFWIAAVSGPRMSILCTQPARRPPASEARLTDPNAGLGKVESKQRLPLFHALALSVCSEPPSPSLGAKPSLRQWEAPIGPRWFHLRCTTKSRDIPSAIIAQLVLAGRTACSARVIRSEGRFREALRLLNRNAHLRAKVVLRVMLVKVSMLSTEDRVHLDSSHDVDAKA